MFVTNPLCLKKQRTLEWFRDFVYCNVDELTLEEKNKLYKEFHLMSGGKSMEWAYSPVLSEKSITETIEKLKDYQAWFCNAFNQIMKKLETLSIHEIGDWSTENDCFGSFGTPDDPIRAHPDAFKVDLLPDMLNVNFDSMAYIEIPYEYRDTDDEQEARWSSNWREESIFRTVSYPTRHTYTYILYTFLEALDGIRTRMVRHCDECYRWFFNISKRDKRYCSNKCAARKINRDKRAELKNKNKKAYKKELKNGKKRARTSYERKIKAVHPQAKIKRKPRKKK